MADSNSGIRTRRFGAVLIAAALGALTFAGPAAAHVRSDGTPVPQGGYGIVRLIVPGESDTAATVGLTVTIPAGVDLKSARTLPIPGWQATVERERAGTGERVARIVWTATDPAAGFSHAEYREFSFSAGPWPRDRATLALPSDQRYGDGSVVRWNEVALDAASEPQHPAPVLTLTAPTSAHDRGHDGGDQHLDEHAAGAGDGADRWWQAVSVVALVLAGGALAGVVLVARRNHGAGR